MLIIKTFIYITIMSIVTANNEFGIFEAANSHYNEGNFGDSIELYEKIILDDFHSSDDAGHISKLPDVKAANYNWIKIRRPIARRCIWRC